MVKIKKILIVGLTLMILLPSSISALSKLEDNSSYTQKSINITKLFSQVSFENYEDELVFRVNECNFNVMRPGYPVIPSLILIYELPFGSIIDSIDYLHGAVQEIPVMGILARDGGSPIDSIFQSMNRYTSTQYELEMYPEDWVSYHVGGGIMGDDHKTFFILRIYPARYDSIENTIHFIDQIDINIIYHEPKQPLLSDIDVYDLLIIAPNKFIPDLQPLVDHKLSKELKTKIIDIDEIYDRMFWEGSDPAEKIKYFIKTAIEEWGISHVLLVGGRKGQTNQWFIPIRYSQVVPPDEQEYPEKSFISDLYFADIYDSKGNFSSWDSNNDGQFSVWNETYKENMDLYPDVYLGRLPCRNTYDVKTMVKKIMKYEQTKADDSWFKNLVLVAGDSYVNNGEDFNEGEIISEEAINLMPGFTPLKVYSSIDDINRKTVNNAMNQGAGFAYFCGHGSSASWSTHFPPAIDDRDNWTTGYKVEDMIFLNNNEKLPITVVGGCHNGQYDIAIPNSIIQGIKESGLKYFLGRFFFDGWIPKCWAWWLTSTADGGAIATIANTGLGTHGEEDSDHNGIIDYLEVLDGWMELRFLELYGIEHQDDLGENHGQTMTEYLHLFIGNNEKMDTKMVQQWQLFGDPSLRIGGYQ